MAQKLLNLAQVGPVLQKVRGEAVAQGMRRGVFRQAHVGADLAHFFLRNPLIQALSLFAEEQRSIRVFRERGGLAVFVQDFFDDGENRHLPFLAALAHHAQEPVAGKVFYVQPQRFVYPQAAAVEQGK